MTLSSTQVAWVADVAPDALAAAEATGLHPYVVLAQWGVETGWGTSPAWRQGFNYAGVSPGGHVARYSSREEGLAAYERAMNAHYYDAVRAAAKAHPDDLTAQATALAESPWAEGHYKSRDGTVGGSLQMALGDLVNSPTPPGFEKYDASLLGEARGINVPGEGIAKDAAGAVGGAISSAIGGLAAPFARAAFTGVFLLAGLGLVVLGVWRSLPDRTRENAQQAATVGAMVA